MFILIQSQSVVKVSNRSQTQTFPDDLNEHSDSQNSRSSFTKSKDSFSVENQASIELQVNF